jgi:DNA-binding LacI/PurR family transcriptional regulator
MKPFHPLSIAEQVAEYLRNELERGNLIHDFPGVKSLAHELGVNHKTVKAALKILETEGILLNQGRGVKRKVVVSEVGVLSTMRIGIFYYDSHTAAQNYAQDLKQAIVGEGHQMIVVPKTLQNDFKMNAKQIIAYAKSFEVDAWIIYAGSSEVLQWFSEYDVPAFSIYGRLNTINIAGIAVRKSLVLKDVVQKLIALGHRRIVKLVREERRKPSYGLPERLFLEELESFGIQTGPFNIPDWKETPEGLADFLDILFDVTPPTALIIGDPVLFHSVQNHLSRRGINAPEDISLFCNDYDECFDWVRPAIVHLQWNYKPTIRRTIQWIKNISENQEDRKVSYFKARLVKGDTIGPVPHSNGNGALKTPQK